MYPIILSVVFIPLTFNGIIDRYLLLFYCFFLFLSLSFFIFEFLSVLFTYFTLFLTSLVAQMVKHLPTMQETRVHSLDGEGLLEKEMATHSSIHAWRIPEMEEPGELPALGHTESDITEAN